MDIQGIQSAIASMKTHLELVESTIEQKKNRKAELKQFVREDKEINGRIGELKKERRELKAKLDHILDFFKSVNDGKSPDAILGPLFAERTTEEEQPALVEFIGYQDLGLGRGHEAMFTVHYDMDRQTSLLKRTLERKGIPIPQHPSFDEWSQSKSVVEEMEA
jgi:hypothetical protein